MSEQVLCRQRQKLFASQRQLGVNLNTLHVRQYHYTVTFNITNDIAALRLHQLIMNKSSECNNVIFLLPQSSSASLRLCQTAACDYTSYTVKFR